MLRLTNSIEYCKMHCDFSKGGECFFEDEQKCYERNIYDKLREYELMEEQGLLLRLPCKVGDSVWLLFADGCIEEHTVSSIRIGNTVDNICFENDSYYTVWDKDYKSLNKWFFTTKEEAEAALVKMKGE